MGAIEYPPSASAAKPNRVSLRPRLRPVEQTLFVLMSRPGEWVKVDEWDIRHSENYQSAMTTALWRRGCEVARRKSDDGRCIRAFAMWPHAVPTEAAPWEVAL